MARERSSQQEPDLFPYIDLHKARLCLDCEMIFEGPQCPACTSETFVPITRWIRPTEHRSAERPSPAPPPVPAPKSKGLLKKSLYLGLGAYGVWKMLFEPGKPKRPRRLPPDIERQS